MGPSRSSKGTKTRALSPAVQDAYSWEGKKALAHLYYSAEKLLRIASVRAINPFVVNFTTL